MQKVPMAEQCPKNKEIYQARPDHGLKCTVEALAGSIRLRMVRASPNMMEGKLIQETCINSDMKSLH